MGKTTTTTNVQLPYWVNQGVQDTMNAYNYATSGIRGRYNQSGLPPTFIADFSPDSLNAHQMARDFSGGSTPADIRNLATGTFGQAATNAMNAMGGLGARQGPTFAPFQSLTGDEAQAAQMQAAQMQAAQVGDVANVAARQGSEFMNSYMNPYLQQVVDTSLADYDVGVDRQAAQNRARRDAGSAFGDRAAIADAVFSADSNRGRGSMSANLRSDAFNSAASFGMQDSNRFLEADRSNQNVALQRALENARLQQAAAEANARMQQQAYQTNAQFAQDTTLRNSDVRNQFMLSNDQRLRDLEMQNFNAGLANDQLRLNALNNQAATAQNQQSTQANLYEAADAARLRQIASLGAVGEAIDDRNQRYNDEYLNSILQGANLLTSMPYETTTTSVSKKKKNFIGNVLDGAKIATAFLGG